MKESPSVSGSKEDAKYVKKLKRLKTGKQAVDLALAQGFSMEEIKKWKNPEAVFLEHFHRTADTIVKLKRHTRKNKISV